MILALFLAGTVRAEVPLPPFPACGEPDRADLCPEDLGGQWSLLSYIPENARDSIRPAEAGMGSGISVDRAWRTTTGRMDVVLAILDTGITWSNSDLVNKIALNTAELPKPQDAGGDTARTWDLDDNGVVNLADWAQDPRVDWDAGEDHADGMLDPSDLIATFSDGVDDDSNGYTDDIAGWDFFGKDNNPWNDLLTGFGDHGTGVMEEAAAEGNNGGDIGVCPDCAILPVRIADSIVSDGTRIAQALAFATEHGAAAVSLATGGLSNPEVAQRAVDYALANGTTLVAVTGDENAYHANFPSVLEGVLYVHSVRFDTVNDDGAVYSYFNIWNCNNYGMRMDVVASSNACATGSAAATTGVVGLLQSAALDQDDWLSPGEVVQLLRMTATDVNLTEEERDKSGAYPSGPGWDPFYGYGRVSAAEAVEAVVSGDIPPVPRLDSPGWFDWISVDQGSVPITGSVAADRSSGYSWSLVVGTGLDPAGWFPLAEGSGQEALEGTLATLDLATLPAEIWTPVPGPDPSEGILERLTRANRPAVTLRLTVTDAEGRIGEDRRTFWVQDDPTVKPGFPFDLGESGEASPTLADLDGDGVFEILMPTSSGRVYALNGKGEAVPGWPVQTDPQADAPLPAGAVASGDFPDAITDSVTSAPAVGDLDGDGSPEVVVASGTGGVYAWHADGTLVDGFPAWSIGRDLDEYDGDDTWDQGFTAAPALADIDGDGLLEIIVPGLDQRLYVFTAAGDDWGPYPIDVCHPDLCGQTGARIVASPSLGDVDGDGDLDVGLGTNEAVDDGAAAVSYVLDLNSGEPLEGWPVSTRGILGEVALLPIIGEGHPGSMAFADTNSDGRLEIANPIMLGQCDVLGDAGDVVLDLDFSASAFGPNTDAKGVTSLVQMMSSPAWGDLDGDGVADLVLGGGTVDYLVSIPVSSWTDYQHAVGAWSGATGAMLPGWPRQVEDLQFLMAPAIADIDGDDQMEAIYGSAGYFLHAWNADGASPAGWPKFVGQWLIGSPAVGDIDGDGYREVVAATREGMLFVWGTEGPADGPADWMGMRHDPQNTGNAETALPTQKGPALEEAGGCCPAGGSGTKSAWLLGLPLLLGIRRRRR